MIQFINCIDEKNVLIIKRKIKTKNTRHSTLAHLKHIPKSKTKATSSIISANRICQHTLFNQTGLYFPDLPCYNNRFFLEVLQGKKKVNILDLIELVIGGKAFNKRAYIFKVYK